MRRVCVGEAGALSLARKVISSHECVLRRFVDTDSHTGSARRYKKKNT